jgi:hypothetical protein
MLLRTLLPTRQQFISILSETLNSPINNLAVNKTLLSQQSINDINSVVTWWSPFLKSIIPFRCLTEETNQQQVLYFSPPSAKITTTSSPICYQQGAHEAYRGNCSSPIHSVPDKTPCNALIDWYSVIIEQSRDCKVWDEWSSALWPLILCHKHASLRSHFGPNNVRFGYCLSLRLCL